MGGLAAGVATRFSAGLVVGLTADLSTGLVAGLVASSAVGFTVGRAVGLVASSVVGFTVDIAAKLGMGCHGKSHGKPWFLPRDTVAGIAVPQGSNILCIRATLSWSELFKGDQEGRMFGAKRI